MLFGLLKKKIATSQPQSTSVPGIEPYYSCCNDLPYEVFKKCCVEKSYHLLGKGEGLEDHWVKLYSEFCAISADENIKTFVSEWAQLTVLESKILRTKLFLSLLFDGYDEQVVKQLEKLGHVITKEKLEEGIDKVLAKLTNMEATAKNLVAGIKKKQKGVEKEQSYADFDEVLNQCEKVFKVPINPATLTAQMYAIKIKDLKEYCRKKEGENV